VLGWATSVPDETPPATAPAFTKAGVAAPWAVIVRLVTPAGTVNVCRLPVGAKVCVHVSTEQTGAGAASAAGAASPTIPNVPRPLSITADINRPTMPPSRTPLRSRTGNVKDLSRRRDIRRLAPDELTTITPPKIDTQTVHRVLFQRSP
jgi:hypothetical protein